MNQILVDDLEAKEIESFLNNHNISMLKKVAKPLDRMLGPPPNPSIQEAPQLELKPLPSHLSDIFLGDNNILLVILFTSLFVAQIDAIIAMLKKRKRALWTDKCQIFMKST